MKCPICEVGQAERTVHESFDGVRHNVPVCTRCYAAVQLLLRDVPGATRRELLARFKAKARAHLAAEAAKGHQEPELAWAWKNW